MRPVRLRREVPRRASGTEFHRIGLGRAGTISLSDPGRAAHAETSAVGATGIAAVQRLVHPNQLKKHSSERPCRGLRRLFIFDVWHEIGRVVEDSLAIRHIDQRRVEQSTPGAGTGPVSEMAEGLTISSFPFGAGVNSFVSFTGTSTGAGGATWTVPTLRRDRPSCLLDVALACHSGIRRPAAFCGARHWSQRKLC